MEVLTAQERQQIEIELLQEMYPEQVYYNLQSCEFKYTGSGGGVMVLRIPEFYPEQGLPDLISATDNSKNNMRAAMKAALEDMRLLQGEELLDALVQGFEHVVTEVARIHSESQSSQEKEDGSNASQHHSKTIVVWLHHLLNVNKRKLALNPACSTDPDGGTVSGITKPGYPGILIYSGPSALVDSHVAELKQQRWQAFQVRYEEAHEQEAAWLFEHGKGIKEVESMSEVVQNISREHNKSVFLQATGVK